MPKLLKPLVSTRVANHRNLNLNATVADNEL
jgi:hypothetical protein